jgi:hypothetical protein
LDLLGLVTSQRANDAILLALETIRKPFDVALSLSGGAFRLALRVLRLARVNPRLGAGEVTDLCAKSNNGSAWSH